MLYEVIGFERLVRGGGELEADEIISKAAWNMRAGKMLEARQGKCSGVSTLMSIRCLGEGSPGHGLGSFPLSPRSWG